MGKLLVLIAVICFACKQGPEEKIGELFELAARTDTTDKPDSSIYYYSQIIELDSLNHPAYFFRARDFLNKMQFEKGILDLNKAIEISPTSDYYEVRGMAFNNIFEYEAGEEDFQMAVKLDPHSAEGYYGLSAVNAGMGKYHTALKYCLIADSIKYDRKQSLPVRALINCGIGNYKEVIEIEKKLITGEKKSEMIGSYYNTMAYAENMLGEYEKAIQHLSLSLSLYPENAYAYNNLAYAHLKTGRIKDALQLVEKSLELYSENAYAYTTRGQIYLAMHQNESACNDFNDATIFAVDSILIDEINGLIDSHCKNYTIPN